MILRSSHCHHPTIIWLVVFRHPSETYKLVNGKDDNPYMKWKRTNVWNHQPVIHNQTRLIIIIMWGLLSIYKGLLNPPSKSMDSMDRNPPIHRIHNHLPRLINTLSQLPSFPSRYLGCFVLNRAGCNMSLLREIPQRCKEYVGVSDNRICSKTVIQQ